MSRIFSGANEIENEDKKTMIFLTSVGTDIFHLMKTLVAPNSFNTKSAADLADLVQNHLEPKSSKILCRFKFNSYNRKAGQPEVEYVVLLHQLAKDCDFRGTLNDMLRDRLVCFINGEKIQLKLLAEKNTLMFENAMELALAPCFEECYGLGCGNSRYKCDGQCSETKFKYNIRKIFQLWRYGSSCINH